MSVTKTRKLKTHNRLFNDNISAPKVKGIGYGTAKKAKHSIQLIKNKPLPYRRQIATTMYYRAKYHKYQTAGMKEAQVVWGKYMKTL
jgi:hypothetical protein